MSWMCNKCSLISLFCFINCLCFLAFYFDLKIENILNFHGTDKKILWRTNVNKTLKTILFWNGMFDSKTFYFGEGDIFHDCPINQCYATYERSYANVEDFDAILFHGAELESNDLPKIRALNQYYVFVNLESPINRPITENFFEEYFNLTMTYRLDSDIIWPYGVVRNLKSKKIVAPSIDVVWDIFDDDEDNVKLSTTSHVQDGKLMNTIAGKKKEVAWLVSNCPAKSRRWEYVQELSKHIKVDIYGNCGYRSTCPYTRDCFRELFEPTYFFYLSFENSLCQDYVTEKLYKPLRYDIIPIVYGGANYSRFVPPNSYIDALNYDSPKDLAVYLKKLIENPEEYQKYFRWKKQYRVEDSTSLTACELCKFLHISHETRMYTPLSAWYSYEKCPLQKLLTTHKYITKVAMRDDTN